METEVLIRKSSPFADLPSSITESALELLLGLLDKDPVQRLAIEDILSHRFFVDA